MPTDQSTDPATVTDRRNFLARTAVGGALLTAGAVAGFGGLAEASRRQEDPAATTTTMPEPVEGTDEWFGHLAAPFELAAVLAYQAAIDKEVLDAEWTSRVRSFQSHHQAVAATLTSLAGEDAKPVADPNFATSSSAAVTAAASPEAVLTALAAVEDALSATHLSAIPVLRDKITAKIVTQVHTVEGQQAAVLAVGGGAAVDTVTPPMATTDAALSPTPEVVPADADMGDMDMSTTTTAAN